jgi:predicted DNA-binding protein YlxM (UPF0122 family)
MNYIEFLKKHESFDKYVLFLLALDFSVADVATMTGMTRQGIYKAVTRNKDIVKEYIDSVKDITDKHA